MPTKRPYFNGLLTGDLRPLGEDLLRLFRERAGVSLDHMAMATPALHGGESRRYCRLFGGPAAHNIIGLEPTVP